MSDEEKPDVKVIHLELDSAVKEADDEEEAQDNIAEELEKIAPLATENWREAFTGDEED